MKPTKPLKDRLTKDILEKLRTRRMTNAEAAILFNVGANYMSRTVAAMQKKNPGKIVAKRAATSEKSKARQDKRRGLAIEAKAGTKSWANAARLAGCSVRTLYRYLEKLESPK